MRKLIVLSLCLSLMGCEQARFAASDSQCKRNNKVDGLAISAIVTVPLIVVAPAAVAVGAGVAMGGSYFITHEALCQ